MPELTTTPNPEGAVIPTPPGPPAPSSRRNLFIALGMVTLCAICILHYFGFLFPSQIAFSEADVSYDRGGGGVNYGLGYNGQFLILTLQGPVGAKLSDLKPGRYTVRGIFEGGGGPKTVSLALSPKNSASLGLDHTIQLSMKTRFEISGAFWSIHPGDRLCVVALQEERQLRRTFGTVFTLGKQ